MKLTTVEEMIKSLPEERQQEIAKRASELIAQEMTMRELRKANQITQADMAKKLGVNQEQISRMEKRTDMHISTLRRTVKAMGGELILTAKFPEGAPVRLTGLAELDA